MSRQIVLDTETTGLNSKEGHRIIEIGCVELINRKITDNNLHIYFNPERDIPEESFKIHGLTTEFLAEKEKFSQKAEEIVNYLKDSELIIHNSAFDLAFLDYEFFLLKMPKTKTFVKNVIDTFKMAKTIYPGKANNLNALCKRLEIDNSKRDFHGALLDSELLASVYLKLTREQNSFFSDFDNSKQENNTLEKINFNELNLPILKAKEEELKEHENILTDMDKIFKSIWHQVTGKIK